MKAKTTKRALLSSVIALALCFTMLLGTTYAWFTDQASSAGNVIKSGTLDVDLGIKTGSDTDYTLVSNDATKKVFDYDLWEPGYTEWANLKVVNDGTLALKYQLKIVANGTPSILADVIDVYYAASEIAKPATRPADLTTVGLTNIGTLADVLNGTATTTIQGTLAAGATGGYMTLVLKMQESAGNQYQNLSLGADFSVILMATQATVESDSFGNDYDAGATFVELPAAAIAANTSAPSSLTTTYGGSVNVPVDSAFTLTSTQTPAEIAGKDYKDWDVDFVLTFNQDVDAGKVYLFGQYDAYSATWLGATLGAIGTTVAAETETLLIKDWLDQAISGVTVNYNEVVAMGEFNCAIHVDSPATGLVATVQLVMTDNAGNSYVLSTFTHSW